MKYLTLVVALVLVLSVTEGAPQMRRHRRHWFESLSVSDDPFHPHIAWKNSCGTSQKNDTTDHGNRTAKPLKGLRSELPNYIVRLNSTRAQAIETDDISQWFSEPFNSTYQFLAQINASISNIHLRKRHIETQVYVGAFQYLRWKQLQHDRLYNENINKTKALEYLLILAKNLLCEIETAINNTGMKMPMILTREVMENRLTFRSRHKLSYEVDEIDSKFAKLRFSEYLHGLQSILKNRMGKQHHNIGKRPRKTMLSRKKVASTGSTHSIAPKLNKSINNTQPHHPNDNAIDSRLHQTRKSTMHRKVGPKHQGRFGNLRKQNRNRKPTQKVAGLRSNDIQHFRSQVPRHHQKSTMATKLAEQTATSTTTIAPQS